MVLSKFIPRIQVILYVGLLIAPCAFADDLPIPDQVDPAETLAMSLWNSDRKDSVIYVKSHVMTKAGFSDVYGTAFLLSNEYALTANHVVCNEDGSSAADVELSVGGMGAVPIPPNETECMVANADVALMRLPTLNSGRKHLDAGIPESSAYYHFVTSYGYGSNLGGGRYIKGNVLGVYKDELNRVRTDEGGAPGDSGAPVLNQLGKVIGVLIAGDSVGATKTTAFVSLRDISSSLEKHSIFVPRPDSNPASENQTPGFDLTGKVMLQFGRSPDGSWPAEATRLAIAGETTVFVFGKAAGEVNHAENQDRGEWAVHIDQPLPSADLEFSILVENRLETDKPMAERKYWSDPTTVILNSKNLTATRLLTLYSRSAYVAFEISVANARAFTVSSSPLWSQCGFNSDAIVSQSDASCSQDALASIQTDVAATDEAYRRAFVASSAEPGDIAITTKIASMWASFRITSNNPCRGTLVMQNLFDQFSNNQLSGPLVGQTLDMIVACQRMPESAAGVMVWRTGSETRQVASVRMIDKILARYGSNPSALKGQRSLIVGDIATAMESYTVGPVTTSEAAKFVSRDPLLRGFLLTFMNKYASALCGSPLVHASDQKSTQRALKQLKTLAATCT